MTRAWEDKLLGLHRGLHKALTAPTKLCSCSLLRSHTVRAVVHASCTCASGKLKRMAPLTVLCLFHSERTASLRVWPDGGYRCHGCGRRGWVDDNDELRALYDRAVTEYRERCGQLRLRGVS